MTLRELIAAHPEHFYTQTWYHGDLFLDIDVPLTAHERPPILMAALALPDLPRAVELAAYYFARPSSPIWRFYLWTADTDQHGQRVYLGENGHGLEIHRHLHLTPRFMSPTWR